LLIFRIVLCAVVAALAAWLLQAARAPSSGVVERVLLLVLAVLLPVHLVLWQLGGIRLLDRLPQLRGSLALLALAASPIVLYPLGLVAIAVSVFAGGTASPALALTGTLMLSPIIALVLIALMFILGRYKGG
jgi:hypothetical protein